LQIELLHVPDCPLVDDVRVTLRGALADAGIDARVEEIEGDFASPTVRIDGVDVTGAEMCNAPACRLDLPTREQILAAIASVESREATKPSFLDKLLPNGPRRWVFFAFVAVGLGFGPHLPGRAGLVLAVIVTAAASSYCIVNFVRCREAHCAVTGTGWAALVVLELVELALGRSLTRGIEQAVCLAILVAGYCFEFYWRLRYGTNAVRRPRRRER